MLSPDLALALLINRTGQAYTASAPAYISYTERTHIKLSIGRTQDINRSVFVRNADDFAVMKDLPDGGERTGQAFPIIPYFDPLGAFNFGYFVNLKLVTINLERKQPFYMPMPTPSGTDIVFPYFSEYTPTYAPDSTESAPHLLISPTPRYGSGFYPADIVVDARSQLPSHIEMRDTGSDMTIVLDFKMLEGHWTVVHGTFKATQKVFMLGSFTANAEIDYENITFPAVATDPRLVGTPTPAPDLSYALSPNVVISFAIQTTNVSRAVVATPCKSTSSTISPAAPKGAT
ncbi:MAG: hypothetical protein M3R30_10210 [Candidatus Eremiobacteraeota bacterium]|nr:hypothetical protein [Candidatus Eremiobacteraeota bacterium]